MNATERRAYIRRGRAALLDAFGRYCRRCGANGRTPLEFAHVHPSEEDAPRGPSRGSYERLREVLQNPFLFMPLCRPCHHDNDGPTWGRR